MRSWLVLAAAFLLAQAVPMLGPWLQGRALDYDPARHGEGVLLVAAGCGYCQQMRRLLHAGGVPFRELDVLADAEGRSRLAAVGAAGVPVLLIGGAVVRGYDPAAVREALAGGADQ